IQHHERHTGDGLAHRIDAKNAVVVHRSGAFQFEMPLRFKIGNLSMTGHERQSTGDSASVDVALQMSANALEALRRETDFFWFHEHTTSFRSNLSPVWQASVVSQHDQ